MVHRNGYDTEDWAKLKANGDARRIPQLLVAIRQAEPVERDEAWRELVDLVHHQGDIYESTVPTLSALLEEGAKSPDLRVQVLDFVAGPAEYIDCPGDLGMQLRRSICDGHSLYVAALRADNAGEREVGAFILGN